MLDTDSNQSNNYQDRGTTLDDLIYEAQGSQVVTSDTDGATGAPLHACRSLAEEINFPSVHSPIPEKGLEFFDGVLL